MNSNYLHSDTTSLILKAFYNVYNTLGYGFLEKVYENAMMIELKKLGLECRKQVPLKVYYDDINVGDYFADIIVENLVIIELKAAKDIIIEHEAQLVNYLRATDIEVGLLLNFGKKPQHKRRVLTSEYK
ncbi:MAG: GxxExxY protein [Bacteroidetes bacterium 4572_117]|nr:MAG: GxxExxY protein [Bacteroidetes bacterium 4572_117]